MIYPYALPVVQEAFAMLGQTKIPQTVDTEQEDPNFRACSMLYESARRRVLLAHPWNFLLRSLPAASSLLRIGPGNTALYACALPGGCLRLLGARGPDGEPVGHVLEGRRILSERRICSLDFLADEEDPEQWTPWVRKVLVHRLAADFSRPVKGSMNDRQLQEQAFTQALEEAMRLNARESSPTRSMRYAHDLLRGIARAPEDRPW